MESLEKIRKSPEASEKKSKYNFEIMESLELQMLNLVGELKESIDKGEYDKIISDDASGRIPSLILKKIIDERNRGLHPELKHQENELQIRFVGAGRYKWEEKEKDFEEFFKKTQKDIRKKALLVTEFMDNGWTIAKLAELMEKAGIDFDIAAVISGRGRKDYVGEFPVLKNHELFIGKEYGWSDLYGKHSISGVQKSEGIFPEKYSVQGSGGEQKEINSARADADILVKEVLDKVWKEK